jgi:hypothetical protein
MSHLRIDDPFVGTAVVAHQSTPAKAKLRESDHPDPRDPWHSGRIPDCDRSRLGHQPVEMALWSVLAPRQELPAPMIQAKQKIRGPDAESVAMVAAEGGLPSSVWKRNPRPILGWLEVGNRSAAIGR